MKTNTHKNSKFPQILFFLGLSAVLIGLVYASGIVFPSTPASLTPNGSFSTRFTNIVGSCATDPLNKYLKGFDSSLNRICVPASGVYSGSPISAINPTTGGSYPNAPIGQITGGKFAKYFQNLSGLCSGSGIVKGFAADGYKICVDPATPASYSSYTPIVPSGMSFPAMPTGQSTGGKFQDFFSSMFITCSGDQIVGGLNTNGSPNCMDLPVIPVNSCAANPTFTNVGTLTTGTPTSISQSWTYNTTPGNCTYTCANSYSGTNCATVPVSAPLASSCGTAANQTYATASAIPTSGLCQDGLARFVVDMSSGLGSYGWFCDAGYFSSTYTNYCSAYSSGAGTTTPAVGSCSANPTFANVGMLTTGSPTSVGQAWTYSSPFTGNCTYYCTNGYSGTNCATAPVVAPTTCNTPDITLPNGQIWSACNLGSIVAGFTSASYGTQYTDGPPGSFFSAFACIDGMKPDTNVQGPCPVGYRIPSPTEWYQAQISVPNLITTLKLPYAGQSCDVPTRHVNQGMGGKYFASTCHISGYEFFPDSINTQIIGTNTDNSCSGLYLYKQYSIRCIKKGSTETYHWDFSDMSNACISGSRYVPGTCKDSVGNTASSYMCSGLGYTSVPCVVATNRYPGCDTDNLVLSNGQSWAMCNIGAGSPNVAGGYYQWGNMSTVFTTGWSSYNWGTNNQGPCATGYHIPTIAEWTSIYNMGSTYLGNLKLPIAGVVGDTSGIPYSYTASYWSSTVGPGNLGKGQDAYMFFEQGYNSTYYVNFTNSRAGGFQLRCLKN